MDTAVTKMTKQWCMLSQRAGKVHRGDKNDQKVVHVVPQDGKGHRGDKNDQKVVHVFTTGW